MTKILITGHTRPSNNQITFASASLVRANNKNWQIITGNESGIDRHLAIIARELSIPLTIWSIDESKHTTGPHIKHERLKIVSSNDFSQRRKLKQWLVDQADYVLVISDGRTNTNAHQTYLYAASHDKKAWLIGLDCKVQNESHPMVPSRSSVDLSRKSED